MPYYEQKAESPAHPPTLKGMVPAVGCRKPGRTLSNCEGHRDERENRTGPKKVVGKLLGPTAAAVEMHKYPSVRIVPAFSRG
jgi:hypothetical protein